MPINVSHRAFTIAEILVAVLILGILFALLLPSLNLSFEKNFVQATFSDNIKIVNKALFNYSVHQLNSNSGGSLINTNLFENGTDNAAEKLSSEFIFGHVGTNCWNGIRIANNLNGSSRTTNLNNLSCFNSKGQIYATQTLSNCNTNLYNNNAGARNKLQRSCGYLFMDINGEKSPNTFGRDVFVFVITDSAPSYLYPIGGQLLNNNAYQNLGSWTNTCGNNNSQEGRTCAGRIIEQGMKVRYL